MPKFEAFLPNIIAISGGWCKLLDIFRFR
jgi:hypothetical protein